MARQSFLRPGASDDERAEAEAVSRLVDVLVERLEAVEDDIDIAHVHGARSSMIQRIVSTILTERLGFDEEVVITPEEGLFSRPRPDFVFEVNAGRKVIAEVERGGTVTNNHDLKDLWKAHISTEIQHLVLVVPVANWNASGHARERPFVRVSHRLGAFFLDERRAVDVLSCHVIGYGRDALR